MLGAMRCGFLLLAAAIAWPAFAQIPPLTGAAVSISAQVRQIDQRDTLWSTYYGSYAKEFAHQRALAVTLKTTGEFDRDIVITWAFVGSDLEKQNRFLIFGEGKRNTTIPRSGEFNFSAESPVFTGSDRNYIALGARDREGVRPAGWAIMIWQRDRFVTGLGSTPDMLAFAQKNTKPPNETVEKEKGRPSAAEKPKQPAKSR